MDKLKHYMSLVDTHWIVVVATGMYTHLREVCIIGLCNDNDVPFHQSYASVLFVFSVLCLLAEYRLWPISLKEPPIQVLYIYEVSLRRSLFPQSPLQSIFTRAHLSFRQKKSIIINGQTEVR